MKQVVLLGSTGSIGKNVLKVIEHLGKEKVQVLALAANQNIELLFEQVKKFNPKMVAVYDHQKAIELQKMLPNVKVVAGVEGLQEISSLDEAKLVVNAIVGNAGLKPMLSAIESKKDVALANKEVLVSAGELIMTLAKKNGCKIIPIDSEHSAIFQCLHGHDIASVSRLILTASGGPFLHHSKDKLKNVTLSEALKHPTWTMGHKITIDSSTLMNKGFEVIEAHWLFGVPIDQIQVLIHPQSVIHSMVEFVDNTIIAQLGPTCMTIPIQLSLTYPDKFKGLHSPFDFTKHNQLQFMEPNTDKFTCLRLAFNALKDGKSYPCYLNAANETLVERFLNKEMSWLDISKKLELLIEKHSVQKVETIDHVLEVDQLARQEALQA